MKHFKFLKSIFHRLQLKKSHSKVISYQNDTIDLSARFPYLTDLNDRVTYWTDTLPGADAHATGPDYDSCRYPPQSPMNPPPLRDSAPSNSSTESDESPCDGEEGQPWTTTTSSYSGIRPFPSYHDPEPVFDVPDGISSSSNSMAAVVESWSTGTGRWTSRRLTSSQTSPQPSTDHQPSQHPYIAYKPLYIPATHLHAETTDNHEESQSYYPCTCAAAEQVLQLKLQLQQLATLCNNQRGKISRLRLSMARDCEIKAHLLRNRLSRRRDLKKEVAVLAAALRDRDREIRGWKGGYVELAETARRVGRRWEGMGIWVREVEVKEKGEDGLAEEEEEEEAVASRESADSLGPAANASADFAHHGAMASGVKKRVAFFERCGDRGQ